MILSKSLTLPNRQVHLDFHTGPWIRDVGNDWDAKAFGRMVKAARVKSMTVFAKCHHGHLYYDTQRPERHPGLKPGLDLLREQVEALHQEGIRAPIYLSVQCDEYAADHHPEWLARQEDGKPVGAGPLSAGWQILDMSSPYLEYLAEQTREVLRVFKPVDGLFFDMCWDQPSLSNHAVETMQREGFDPEKAEDRSKFAHKVALNYMKRFYDMVKSTTPDATCYFNSRPLSNLAEEVQYLTQVEIEALPTGGWGYMYFPKNVRFARTFDRPYLGMTARFHKSWADFGGLKPFAALEYETAQMMAHGAQVSIGDQLHPRGTLDPVVYEMIGKAYERIEAREPWLTDAKPVAQIGLFQAPSGSYFGTGGADEGATRMLTQLKHQFDVVGPSNDLEKYELLILPDSVPMDDAMSKRLSGFLKKGGAVLASGMSGLANDGREVALKELGIQPAGMSPFTTTYVRFGEGISEAVPPTDHVMYERSVRVKPAGEATELARIVEPYFERSWKHFSSHNQTPGDKLSDWSAATLQGKAAYIAYPIFGAFANHGNYPCRLMVRNVIRKLLPEALLSMEAPTSTEATVMRQGNRTIVHVLQYAPERRTPTLDIVEDVVPLYDVPMTLKLPSAPKKVYLAPEGTEMLCEYVKGHARVVVPVVRGHAMVVFE